MDNRTLLKVTLGAFGLIDDLDNRAFIRRVLESDLTDSTSLANRLSDKRYQALAVSFNFNNEGGPRLPNEPPETDISRRMAELQSVDDLFNDRELFRAALAQFGQEDNAQNTFYLRQALESDLNDPTSFVNQLKDPQLLEMARSFNFGETQEFNSGMAQTASTFSGRFDEIRTTEQLLANEELLEAALGIYGLENAIYNTTQLRDVLNSDLTDPTSVANQLDDPRFAAFSGAFGFGNPITDGAGDPVFDADGNVILDADGNPPTDALGAPVDLRSSLEKYVDAFETRSAPVNTPAEFFEDVQLYLTATKVFGIDLGEVSADRLSRILNSDPEVATSPLNTSLDPRIRPFFDSFSFTVEPTERTYPDGFVEQITQNYVDRQFEIAIGESNPTMRIALALERDFNQLLERSSTNDARWFNLMASTSIRPVFETAFNLPTSIGTLDLDRQLIEFKDRSERFFGTTELGDFADPDRLEQLVRRYLLTSEIAPQQQAPAAPGSVGVAVSILQGFGA